MSGSIIASTESLVGRLYRAIETADAAALDALYTDGVAVWQNFTRAAQSKSENIALLLRAAEMGTLSYSPTEIIALDNRLFVRHVLTTTTHPGPILEIPGALFITVEGDRISQIFEYVDSAQFAVPSFAAALVTPAG